MALRALALGFVGHPRNVALRDALEVGSAAVEALNAELMRVVLQIAVLLAMEERGALLHPADRDAADVAGRERYATRTGALRLRRLAETGEGGDHGGLWRRFVVFREALSGDPRREGLRQRRGLLALEIPLLRPSPRSPLTGAHLRNRDLLEAVRRLTGRALAQGARAGAGQRAPVCFASFGVAELGALHEGLLALAPRFDGEHLEHVKTRGSARRVSGSYYTPDELVECLLDTALEPVIADATQGGSPAARVEAILALRVCDPAAGAGSFLVGAARRLAAHLVRARAEVTRGVEAVPWVDGEKQALRDVIAHCLHGVDVDPLSVGLCQVGLWFEAGAPALSFLALEKRIRVGNSLLGATPAQVARGVDDAAFVPLEGDDPATCRALRKRNRDERREGDRQTSVPRWFDAPATRAEERHAHLLGDAWCAAFLQPRTMTSESHAVTTGTLRRLMADPLALSPERARQVEKLSSRHALFHWHLEFPEVHRRGGFDCVLGNPPWEHAELKEKEWFAERIDHIARTTTGAERKGRIEHLRTSDPALHAEFTDARRRYEETHHFLGASGSYPLCGRGRINLYAIFAEASRALLRPGGRCGCIVPSGIATDDSTKRFFQEVVDSRSLVSLLDFENKRRLFPDVAPPQKFCLLTMGTTGVADEGARYAFFAHAVADARREDRLFTLTPDDISLLNPNTRTCPVFRSKRDAELTKALYRRAPVLVLESPEKRSPWAIHFRQGLFNMTTDSHLFGAREALEAQGLSLRGNAFERGGEWWLPVYEAKMVHHFDHRYNTFEDVPAASRFNVKAGALPLVGKADPHRLSMPRFWVPAAEVEARWPGRRHWALVFRSITNVSTNRRTAVFSVVPRVGIGNSAPLISSDIEDMGLVACLYGALTSFVFDFVARQSVGGSNFNFFIVKQLVVPAPLRMLAPQSFITGGQALPEWMLARILELTFTSCDLEPFARDCGWDGPPFAWDEARRFALRCELDAAFMHLFMPSDARGGWIPARTADGCPHHETAREMAALTACFATPRDAAAHILDTFPIVAAQDAVAHGAYRTKRRVLEVYDRMQAARRLG